MRIRLPFNSLSTQITVLSLALLLILTLVVGVIAYRITRSTIEVEGIASLEALATARQTAIKIQLENYKNNLLSFAHPNLAAETTAMLAASGEDRIRQESILAASMKREQPIHSDLEWADIVDLSGEVIISTNTANEGRIVAKTPVFMNGVVRPSISDPFIDQGTIYIELSMPLNDGQDNTVAVLIHRYNARALLSITGDYTGLGSTGETVLGVRRGEEVHFLTPRRFASDVSSFEPLPISGGAARPMIGATAGQSGAIQAPDYRSVQVIAAYRPIQETGWGIVVKQDVVEAFAGISQLRTNLMMGLGLALLAGAIIVAPLTHNFVQPLNELERATRKVAAGDLSTHVPISQLDEVGQVAESFNAMVRQLSQARDELTHSNRELSSFAYVVSHDLKTPLRGIASLSTWLVEDLQGKLEGEQIEQLRLLRERVQRMDALINGLLDYSRVGRVRNPEIVVDVNTLLVRVIDTASPPEGIRINVTTKMPRLQTDELHLTQVFQNLISNAVNHHPGPQGKVEISGRDQGDFWEFTVRDDGLGIEPRHHERIFQMFQSLQTNQDVESTGIGLALVRKIVEEHGGKVWVESQGVPGQGSIFRFTWPKTK